jgi:hypothetical protein
MVGCAPDLGLHAEHAPLGGIQQHDQHLHPGQRLAGAVTIRGRLGQERKLELVHGRAVLAGVPKHDLSIHHVDDPVARVQAQDRQSLARRQPWRRGCFAQAGLQDLRRERRP